MFDKVALILLEIFKPPKLWPVIGPVARGDNIQPRMAEHFASLLEFLCKLNGFFDGIIWVVMRICQLFTDPSLFHSAVLKPLLDLLEAQTNVFGNFSLLLPGR